MRKRVAEYEMSLPVTSIELGSTARLPGDYVAGHALGVSYSFSALPDEAKLRTDLQLIVRAYRALTYRGGVDADVESQSDVGEEFNLPTSTTVVETRKYAFHRKIERIAPRPDRPKNSTAPSARPAILILPNAMDRLVRALLKHIT